MNLIISFIVTLISLSQCCDISTSIMDQKIICQCTFSKDNKEFIGIGFDLQTGQQELQEFFQFSNEEMNDLMQKEYNLNIVQIRSLFERKCRRNQEMVLLKEQPQIQKVDYVDLTYTCVLDHCLLQILKLQKQKEIPSGAEQQLLICLYQIEANEIISCLQETLEIFFPCFIRNCNPLDLLFRCNGIKILEDILYNAQCIKEFTSKNQFISPNLNQPPHAIQNDLLCSLAAYLIKLDLYCDSQFLKYVKCLAGLNGNNNTQDSINQLIERQIELHQNQCQCDKEEYEIEEEQEIEKENHPLQCVDLLENISGFIITFNLIITITIFVIFI